MSLPDAWSIDYYTTGAVVQMNALFTTLPNGQGTPVDPTSLSLTVRDPSGAETVMTYNPGTIVRTGVGTYYDQYQTILTGLHTYRWAAVNANAVAGERQFTTKSYLV